mmetsp:Transcript_4409/g.13366  ORF Transcript_4409/g.13366 Transcript_4409/m.13366 type:complete len:511 (-) Transcript_4409:44-1576(-)
MDAAELRSVISRATTRKAPPQRAVAKKAEKTEEEIETERKRKDEEEKEEEELERACEQWCSKICRIGIVVPLLFSYVLYPLGEYGMRPNMVIDDNLSLAGTHAIVTGGCGGLGLETATMLARAGASVAVGCRDTRSDSAVQALKALRVASGKWSESNGGIAVSQPAVMQLRLDSMASVRSFAAQYTEQHGKLNLLVNNAGTRQACTTTDDGIEVAFQVNYLGHFQLTNLMLPLLRQSSPARVVHVTCRDGYVRPAHGWNQWFKDGWFKGWLGLPVPIVEGIRVGTTSVEPSFESVAEQEEDGDLGHAAMDDEDHENGGSAQTNAATPRRAKGDKSDWSTGCRPEKAYANAKLAVLTFSHELERRLRESSGSEGVVSHAVNPNVIATEFVAKGAPPSTSQQWSYFKVMSYFPPVWISRKAFTWVHTHVCNWMLRSVEHGARAVVHVATAEALAGAGGTLFDDLESAFVRCGRPAHKCGRVPRSWQPPVANDLQAGSKLWELSEELLKERKR